MAGLPDRARVRLRDLVVARLAVRDGGRPGPARLLRSDGPPPAAPRARPPRRRHGAALLGAARHGPGPPADPGQPPAAGAGLLPPLLRGHRALRSSARRALRPRVLRSRARAVR